MHIRVTRVAGIWTAAVVCLFATAAESFAEEPTGDALFVTVQNPISSDAVTRIRNQITSRRVETIVFDFNPDAKPSASTDFGTCFDLAEFISSLKGQNTIAFVHASTTGHTVLPVLACKEVVMGRNGVLGPIVIENIKPLDNVRQTAYRTKFNRDDRWPLVQQMFDPAVKLVSGVRKQGGQTMYVDARDEAALQQIGGAAPVAGVQEGQHAAYPVEIARVVGLAQGRADTRKEVAELYNLPASSVRDDPLRGRSPVAFQWMLKGDVDGAMRESVNRVIRDVRKKDGNILILILNCGGTDLDIARGLADDLVKAQTGDDAIQIVGFIPESAPDAATVVALGCSEIVMTRPRGPDSEIKEADIGNFERYLKSAKPATIDAQRKALRELAELRSYPGILIDGMFDRSIEIVRARGTKTNHKKTRLMTRQEFADLQTTEPDSWIQDKVVKPPGMPFQLNATLAAELGLARYTVPSTDIKSVSELYGVTEARNPDPGILDRFAEFLRIPAVTIILVMVGFIGLILELKVPGLTVPGIVAALCFILVFWSQSKFSGEMFVLALLLFLLGLVLIGLEIFVLPGFGVCGISGILFMLAGLALVTFDRAPQNTAEWVGFGERISYYLFALMGAMVVAFLIAKFLPQVPYANRLLLAPPSDQPLAGEPMLPGAMEAAELLGAIGTTTTALRPAGVVRFGDKFVDVVSDGGFIASGTRVQVFAVEGTRIVVKEV